MLYVLVYPKYIYLSIAIYLSLMQLMNNSIKESELIVFIYSFSASVRGKEGRMTNIIYLITPIRGGNINDHAKEINCFVTGLDTVLSNQTE